MNYSLFIALIVLFSTSASAHAETGPHVYTDTELLEIAGNDYAAGDLPLGDGHYTTDVPLKGYITLCHAMKDGHGAQKDGPWIHGKTWNIKQKIAVKGNRSWEQASFTNELARKKRILSGNSLPLNHGTGIFPIAPDDPAYVYDKNPNSIKVNSFHDVLPISPVYSETPYCMGGEAGIMLTGVPLYNGFDAELRDAPAHEVQDDCNGHPQKNGQYHYHSLSSCITRIGVKIVVGYALDGFPITGPMVAENKYLTTDDLDECHGITSEIVEDGQRRTTYHYVMTQDFPYSVSCFRAKPTRLGPSMSPNNAQNNQPADAPPSGRMNNPPINGGPPPEALAACLGKHMGAACTFTSPRGDHINGTCAAPPNMPLACRP